MTELQAAVTLLHRYIVTLLHCCQTVDNIITFVCLSLSFMNYLPVSIIITMLESHCAQDKYAHGKYSTFIVIILYCTHVCIALTSIYCTHVYILYPCLHIVPMSILYPCLHIVPMSILYPCLFCSHVCIVPMSILYPR